MWQRQTARATYQDRSVPKLSPRSSYPLTKNKSWYLLTIHWPYCASSSIKCVPSLSLPPPAYSLSFSLYRYISIYISIYIITFNLCENLKRRYQLSFTDKKTKLRNSQNAKVSGKREFTKGLCSVQWIPLPPSLLTTFLKASIPHNHNHFSIHTAPKMWYPREVPQQEPGREAGSRSYSDTHSQPFLGGH